MIISHAKARTLDLGTHLIAPYTLGHLDHMIIIHVIIRYGCIQRYRTF